MNKTKIYLTDDHAILRDGLKSILNNIPKYEVIGESADGETTLKEINKLHPDILILDISLPTISGVEVCRQVRKYYPDVKIIILTRHDNEVYIEQLLKFGIAGYVLKENAANDLTRAIEAAEKGNLFLSPEITGRIVTGYKKAKDKNEDSAGTTTLKSLTNQETSILKLIAEGNSSKEIASLLCISPATAKKHRTNIMKKLDIHNVADLIVYAIKTGIKEI